MFIPLLTPRNLSIYLLFILDSVITLVFTISGVHFVVHYIRCSLRPIFKSRPLSHCYKDPQDPQLLGVRGGAGWMRARPPLDTFAGTESSPVLLLQSTLQLLVLRFLWREIPRRPRLCKWRSPENPRENAEKEGQQ